MTTARATRACSRSCPRPSPKTGELDLESQKRCVDFMIDAGSRRPVHPRQLLRAVPAGRRRARDAHAHRPRARRRPRAGDRDHHPLQHPHLRRAQPPRAGHGRGDGDGDAAVPRRHLPRRREPQIHEFYARAVRRDRHPDHDPGRAGRRHAAVSAPFLARMAQRDRARPLLQDRRPRARRQAARTDPPRRRRDRRPVGRRGSDHAAARPRCRRHRLR